MRLIFCFYFQYALVWYYAPAFFLLFCFNFCFWCLSTILYYFYFYIRISIFFLFILISYRKCINNGKLYKRFIFKKQKKNMFLFRCFVPYLLRLIAQKRIVSPISNRFLPQNGSRFQHFLCFCFFFCIRLCLCSEQFLFLFISVVVRCFFMPSSLSFVDTLVLYTLCTFCHRYICWFKPNWFHIFFIYNSSLFSCFRAT